MLKFVNAVAKSGRFCSYGCPIQLDILAVHKLRLNNRRRVVYVDLFPSGLSSR